MTDTNHGLRWGRLAVMILGLAMLFGLLEAGQTVVRWNVTDYEGTFGQALAATLPQWFVLAALAPAVLWVAARFRLDRGSRTHTIPIHIVASLLFVSAGAPLMSRSTATGIGINWPWRAA